MTINSHDGTFAIDCWKHDQNTARDPQRMFFGEEEDVAGLLLKAHELLQSKKYGRIVLCKKETGEPPDDWKRLTELRTAS